ncbi:MAG: sugar ABC transporter substrate-binding protein [Rhizobiaceae bacterium]
MLKTYLKAGALAATLVTAAIGAASAQDLAAKAEAELSKYRAIPTFEPAGEPFDAKACMAGKRILSIPASSAVPFIATINEGMKRLAGDLGFEYQVWENQGQVAQWVQGLDYAAANKFDLVEMLAGADPRAVEPQIKAVQAAGGKVIASHLTGFEQAVPGAADGVVPIDYRKAGELMAWWTIGKTEGKTNALVLIVSGALSTDSIMDGLDTVFKENCPDCKTTVIDVPVSDWATKIQPAVQAALLADPNINYVVPIYDSMSQFVLPALTITGRQLPIATFNGTPFVLDLIQQGQVEMDIGENLDWISYGVLDSHMRRLCGLEVPKDPKIPLLIFDKDNAASAGTPAEVSVGYGDAYIAGYKALWKLQ